MTDPACTFPACPKPPTERNRRGDPTCGEHQAVVVAAWAAGRNEEGVSEQ